MRRNSTRSMVAREPPRAAQARAEGTESLVASREGTWYTPQFAAENTLLKRALKSLEDSRQMPARNASPTMNRHTRPPGRLLWITQSQVSSPIHHHPHRHRRPGHPRKRWFRRPVPLLLTSAFVVIVAGAVVRVAPGVDGAWLTAVLRAVRASAPPA